MIVKMLDGDYHYRSFKSNPETNKVVVEDLYMKDWIDGTGPLRYVQTDIEADTVKDGKGIAKGGVKGRYQCDVAPEGIWQDLLAMRVDEIDATQSGILDKMAKRRAAIKELDKAEQATGLENAPEQEGFGYEDEGAYYTEP